ncbi:MAG: magnesium/cobalt transporter CorA [Deltaproteobacteria bacterium]|nr:magnesium/cobalt transporter CorA [Deltaproteobacteria bacterium]MBK8237312.1 magnesium/cobalt transporter CorA [Deltaproteobacteria bacterium]MBK8719003.1 magnesium/cobalt transporter CorA [Deltaproteobacteria bacterium]MBP7285436.1 magnesium/cobalt transporter CorA [Nannocystaceae bacterium]
MSKRSPKTKPPGGEQRRRRRRQQPPGLHTPPGTLTAEPDAAAPVVHAIAYGPVGQAAFEAHELDRFDAGEIARLRRTHAVTWLHVVGLRDAGLVARIGEAFGLHDLALEDVLHTNQRPKIERFDAVLQIVLRIVDEPGSPETEQLTVFIGEGFVVSFEERKGDIFEVVRQRIRDGSGLVCDRTADFLAYALLDVAVDAFFPVLEGVSDELEAIEDVIPTGDAVEIGPRLRRVKHQLLGLRRALWPLREVLGALTADDSPLIHPDTRAYLRDCQSHCAQLIDIVTVNRELATDLVDLQLSVAGQRMNEVMKVLTVMATLFIPLTFISSVYGMNFDPNVSPLNMPELRWFYGYPFALSLMFGAALVLLWWFRRRGWL